MHNILIRYCPQRAQPNEPAWEVITDAVHVVGKVFIDVNSETAVVNTKYDRGPQPYLTCVGYVHWGRIRYRDLRAARLAALITLSPRPSERVPVGFCYDDTAVDEALAAGTASLQTPVAVGP